MSYDYTYVTVDVADTSPPDPIDYTITVLDHYSKQPIEDAQVFLDGVNIGFTDDERPEDPPECRFPGRPTRSEFLAAGYQDSAQDIISNDESHHTDGDRRMTDFTNRAEPAEPER